MLRRCFSN